MTNIGNTRRSTGSSPRKPLTVPTLLVDSEWDQEDIYGAPAVFNAVKASDNGNAHLVLGPWHHGEANGAASTLGPLDWGSTPANGSGRTFCSLPRSASERRPARRHRPGDCLRGRPNQWQRLHDWPLACARGCPAA